MPTRNISLTDELDSYIEQSVRSGHYDNASEVVRAAIRALKQAERKDWRGLSSMAPPLWRKCGNVCVEELRPTGRSRTSLENVPARTKRCLRSCGNIRLHSRHLGRTAGRKLR